MNYLGKPLEAKVIGVKNIFFKNVQAHKLFTKLFFSFQAQIDFLSDFDETR